ncbi:MAG: hypothetical protein UHK60_03320 [Acutalibacteraceae bacterium]|nr:hypothetical protein [Acutalibacteraceae bacterium]
MSVTNFAIIYNGSIMILEMIITVLAVALLVIINLVRIRNIQYYKRELYYKITATNAPEMRLLVAVFVIMIAKL